MMTHYPDIKVRLDEGAFMPSRHYDTDAGADSPMPYTFRRGDKISQLVVHPVCYPTYREASEIQAGERGDNGFGSTGRL